MTVTIMRGLWGSSSESMEPRPSREPDELWFSWLANPGTYWRYTLCTALLSTCRCQVHVPESTEEVVAEVVVKVGDVSEGPAILKSGWA